MKVRYFFKVLGITIFSLFLLNNIGMAQIHYDNTGNVGIGTTSPTEKLDVAGTVKATSFVGDGSQLTGINGSGQWSEGTGGIYYNNGNIGIGTTSPSHKLEVNGNVGLIMSGGGSPNLRFGEWGGGRRIDVTMDNSAEIRGLRFQSYDPDYGGFDLMTINYQTGNVGIGTTSPEYKLHVDGDIYATGTVYGASGTADTDWTESGGNVYRELGNIGIGVTSPARKLEINSNGTDQVLRLNRGPGISSVFDIGVDSQRTDYGVGFWDYSGNQLLTIDGNGGLAVGTTYSANNAPADGAIIEGNVGIGTTSPEYKLHVDGDIYATGTVYGASGTADTDWTESGGNVYRELGNVGIGTTNPTYGKLQVAQDVDGQFRGIVIANLQYAPGSINETSDLVFMTKRYDGGLDEIGKILGGKSSDYSSTANMDGYLAFYDREDGNFSEVMRITKGNIGIGTTSPQYELHIDTDGSNPEIALSNNGSLKSAISGTGPGDFSIFTNDGGLQERMRIKQNGNVGIGTTSPSYKLHVNGTAYAAGAAGALSDRRDKKNISDLSFDALEVVSNLHPVTFEWKEPLDSGMEGTQLGFIAQEVEGLLPEAVLTQDNEEQTKGLKYNALIPLLTKAIKELKAQNEALKAENNSLRYEIEQIKDAIGL